MKILIIRFSSIGDIVLTTPVPRCIKQQAPEHKVHYLTKGSFWPIFTHNPYIDKMHFLVDDLDKVIEELKLEKFDLIIDLHNNLRTAKVKKALGVKSHTFKKLNIKKWIYTNLKVNQMPPTSIVDRYMETVKSLNIHNDGKGLDYFLLQDVHLSSNDIPMSHWGGFVGCVIGGSFNTKKLPVEQWRKFCSIIPFPLILLGGPEDREEGELIAEQDRIKIYNSCGKFNLNESAELVKLSRVVISNDTGLMHIATAFQKPIVSLWGNTSPELGMFPYYGFNDLNNRIAPGSIIMENKNIACHPCSKIGYNKCPKRHFKCMVDLDMNKASEAVKKLWAVETSKMKVS